MHLVFQLMLSINRLSRICNVNYRNLGEIYLLGSIDNQVLASMICFLLERWTRSVDTASVLLARGADPNASIVPLPVLFFAIKNSDSETVRQLLLRGAKADHISSNSVCTFLVSLLCCGQQLLLHIMRTFLWYNNY